MGLREDLERYRAVGEERRQDLAEFIQYGDLGQSRQDEVRIPIKIVDLPEFAYDQRDMGGVGQGEGAEEGDPVGQPQPQPGDGDEEGDPGEEGGEHEYYEMDPEEFAQELDEQLGLDLDPKGKKVVEESEGDFTDITRTGPSSTLDFEHLFKEGLKRKLAMDFDRDFVREALKVDGWGPATVFDWARDQHVPVSKAWLEETYDDIDDAAKATWDSIEEMEANVERTDTAARIRREGVDQIPFRREDERYRYPEVVEEKESATSSWSTSATSPGRCARRNANSSSGPSRRWTGTSRASTTTPSSSTSPTTPTPGRSTARSSSASDRAAGRASPAPTRSLWSASKRSTLERVEPLRLRRRRLRELFERHRGARHPADGTDSGEPPRLRGDSAQRERHQRDPARRSGVTSATRAMSPSPTSLRRRTSSTPSTRY